MSSFRMRRAAVRYVVLVGVVLLTSVFAVPTTSNATGEITNSYSDNANLFYPNDVWNYLIYRSDSSLGTQTTNQHIIYARDNSGRVLTLQYDDRFYVESRVDNNSSSGYQSYGKTGTYSLCNNNAKDMTLTVSSALGSLSYGTSDGGGQLCTANSISIFIAPGAFSYDSDLAMYKAQFSVSFSSEGYSVRKSKIEYRMGVNGSETYLSYAAGGKSAVKRNGGPDSNAVQYFPFGPACTVTWPSYGVVTLYDMDNGNNDGVSGAPAKKAVYVRILRNGSPISLSGGVEQVVIGDEGGTGTYLESGTKYLPKAGSNQNVYIYITQMQPRAKYMLELSGASIHYNNFIQVGLPAPSIYGAPNIACPDWTMNGYTDISASTALLGESVTFWHHVYSSGTTNTRQDIWSDTQVSGGVGTAKSGHNNGWFAPGENKTTDVDTITIPDTASNGTQYCQRVGYQWSAWNSSAYGSGAWKCVTVDNRWTISGYTDLTTPSPATLRAGDTVYPGQSVTFWHHVKNNGPHTTNMDIWSDTQVVSGVGTARAGHSLGRFVNGQDKDSSSDTVTIPMTARNGYKACQRVGYQWSAYNNSAYGNGPLKCATVQYDYTLRPIVSVDNTTPSPGEPVKFTASVENSQAQYYANDTDWAVRRIVVPAGTAIPSGWNDRTGTVAAQFACSYYLTQGASECTNVATGTTGFPGSVTSLREDTDPVDYPLGTHICFAVMLNSYTQNPQPNYREVVTCAVVAKYPTLDVENGMVRTGAAVTSTDSLSCSLATAAKNSNNDPYGILMHAYSSVRGSRAQAAVALGRIVGFGSAGLYYSDTTGSPSTPFSRRLLFGNSAYKTTYTANGLFFGASQLTAGQTGISCLPDTASLYQVASATTTTTADTTVHVNDLSSGAYAYTLASGRTLTLDTTNPAHELAAGKRVVLYVAAESGTATITIASDITYAASGYGSIAELPQLVVIGGKGVSIKIAAAVTSLSGIFSTKQDIYTCDSYDGTSTMDATLCNKKLTVRGALIATGRVFPYRTYGYDTKDNLEPAEVLNLTPETLLGDYDRASELPTLTTSYQKEVPTRL